MDDLSSHEADLDFTRHAPAEVAAPRKWPASAAEVEIGGGAADADGYHVTITRREPKPRAPAGRRIVLIIEDDENVRMALEHYLGADGYATRTAGTRREIQAALQTAPLPDLIFLDVDMPDADGFDLLEKFTNSKVVGNVPVVMLTARCSRKDITRGLSLGAAGYITKPAKMTVISDALRALVG